MKFRTRDPEVSRIEGLSDAVLGLPSPLRDGTGVHALLRNVRSHLLVPALTVLIAAFAMGAFLWFYQPRPAAAPGAPKNPLVRPQPKPSAFGWTLVKAASAHTAMVLEVETSRPWEAVAIAQQLTEPYKDRFDEVLVFFFVPEAEPRLAVRRVQWTRANGYQTLELRPAR